MSPKERLYRFRSFWIFPPIALVVLNLAFRAEPQSSRIDLLWLFLLGMVIWTLLEYGLHRFVFHIQVPPQNPRLRNLVNAIHLGHHSSPRDAMKVLVRPVYALAVSAVLYGILDLVSSSLFVSAGIMAGTWAGFLYYEAVHYRVHFSLSPSGIISRQRRAHFHHHFTNNRRCFGVTSPLWDHVFGTALPK